MKAGDVLAWSRTFSREDIQAFAKFSGDEGVQHTVPNARGQLMAHGLLTATLPTKIGGDLNYLAENMLFRFLRPVYAGDTIRCEVRIDDLEEAENSIRLSCSWTCTNQEGGVVMTGESQGQVRKPP